MKTREIRVVTQQEHDRTSMVETIEGLGHHVIEVAPSDKRDVGAIIVVDYNDPSTDLSQITAELDDHDGPVVLITNRSGNELDALAHGPSTMVVVGDDLTLGYEIAFRLCAAMQAETREKQLA